MAVGYRGGIIAVDPNQNMFAGYEKGLQLADEARARQNQINYEEALKTYGEAAYNGDPEAQSILAQYDPAGIATLRSNQAAAKAAEEEKQYKREQDRLDREERMGKALAEELAKKSEAEQKAIQKALAEAAVGALAAGAFTSDEAMDAFAVSQGMDPNTIDIATAMILLPPEYREEALKQRRESSGAGGAFKPKITTPSAPETTPKTNMLTPPTYLS